MIVRTRGQEQRLNLFTNASRIPRYGFAVDDWTGANVTRESAAGLPAVAAAIRLTSETLGMTPLIIYREKGEGERERARQSWQWDLLHDAPSPEFSAFDLFTDIGTSIESTGDAFVFKVKVDRQVVALFVMEPSRITVKRNDESRKIYEVSGNGGAVEKFTSSDILHIRGWTVSPGADRGVSPITLHRHSLGGALAQEEFQSKFYKQGATIPGVIQLPQEASRVSEADIDRMRERFVEKYGGLENAHKPAVLRFGAEWKTTGISHKDAEFVESRKLSVEDIARIFRISPTMLGFFMAGRPSTAEDFERFLKVDMGPRYRRIEQALRRDRDLFPQTSLFPEFLADSVLRPDVKTRYEAYRLARQGGWLAPNEIREKENYPPKDGGDDIQITPVGGAPNQDSQGEEAEPDAMASGQ